MAASPLLCNNCGTSNPSNESFCRSCGYTLTATSSIATSTTSTGQLSARTLLRQRYRVLSTVGQGGMGAVYMAQDTQLGDRFVAVKEMSQQQMSGQRAQVAIESFQQEAHLLAKLQHPNLPSIHDYFEEAGRWYLVMSFIQGETLADYLAHKPDQKLTLEETLALGLTLCTVLDYLHTQQPPIIFRDLKPSNIMRTADGHLYLIDFGIARHFKPGQTKDTASYGSMGYSPPEQYGRAQTTERSDIYSLGVTLYECLTGYDPTQSPFRFPPVQDFVPTLPEKLIALITQMLALDSTTRPASIKEVIHQLQLVQTPQPASKRRAVKSATFRPPVPPLAPTQYASPPPQQPIGVGQILIQPTPMYNVTPVPATQSRFKHTLMIIGKVLSVTGMIIGGFCALIGLIGVFFGGPDTFANMSFGGLILFFGLMIFFIARIRRQTIPVSNVKKIEAILGKIVCIFAALLVITILIIGAVTPNNGEFGAGVIASAVIIGEAVVIRQVTRLKRKRLPKKA